MRKCLYCKRYFLPHDSRQIYCNSLCRAKCKSTRRKKYRKDYYNKNREILLKKAKRKRLQDIVNRRKKDIESKTGYMNCILCGKKIFGYKKYKKYCNICRKKIKRELLIGNQYWKLAKHFKGLENPNWNGGTTPWREQIRGSFLYKKWRTDVFKRDNYTCQKCGLRSKKGLGKTVYLEAHHSPSFISLLNKYNINSKENANRCSEFWNINLGITLCKKCHNLTKKGNPNL